MGYECLINGLRREGLDADKAFRQEGQVQIKAKVLAIMQSCILGSAGAVLFLYQLSDSISTSSTRSMSSCRECTPVFW